MPLRSNFSDRLGTRGKRRVAFSAWSAAIIPARDSWPLATRGAARKPAHAQITMKPPRDLSTLGRTARPGPMEMPSAQRNRRDVRSVRGAVQPAETPLTAYGDRAGATG